MPVSAAAAGAAAAAGDAALAWSSSTSNSKSSSSSSSSSSSFCCHVCLSQMILWRRRGEREGWRGETDQSAEEVTCVVRGVTAEAVVEVGTVLIVHMVVRVHGAPHPVVPEEEGVHWSWSNGPRGGSSTAIVRISGLDYSVLDSELRELMEKSCEGILKVWIDYDKTDRSRGTGGCVFRTLADAQRAVETFDGRRIEGKPLRLELQRPRGPPGGPPNSWGQSQGQGPSSWGQGPPRGGDRGYNRW
ncbi:hypothetical protein, conserved [Eimeria maxima]|uniref:RRM domain-containing protein n=1 Tax=Eimeria maxima TaxID=5804 RepID=U6MFE1_EIMMA|nr:hypothetical protein, conserved [Eimeria maxima]CDJ61164.1 hypothetical protein, conserved [Eimeria maxima]